MHMNMTMRIIHANFCNLAKVLSQILNLRTTELLRFILSAIQRAVLMKHKAVPGCQVEGGVQENLPALHPSTLSGHTHTSKEGRAHTSLVRDAFSAVGS